MVRNGMVKMKNKIAALDFKTEKPLYKQLEEQLTQYIAAHLPGDKLPSERKIAEDAGVNRETVRKAISAFIEKGEIHRSGKGTYISGNDSEEQPSDEIHPLFFADFQNKNSSVKLRFATFENLPAQREFWEKCAEDFKKKTGNSISLENVPKNINSPERYAAYIEEEKPDLIMLASSHSCIFKRQSLLEKLPLRISKQLESDKFVRIQDSDDGIIRKYCAPISFSPWGIFFNRALAEQYQMKDLKNTLKDRGLNATLKHAGSLLPPEIKVAGNIWNYMILKGVPDSPEKLETFLLKSFGDLQKEFSSPNDIFIFDQTDPGESQRLFLEGKLLFHMTFLLSLSSKKIGFPVETVWSEPEAPNRISTLSTCLGISSFSESQEAAGEFIDYVLSEEVQKKISETCASGIRKKTIHPEFTDKYTYDKAEIASFMIFKIRDLYKKVASGTISPGEATQTALERYK